MHNNFWALMFVVLAAIAAMIDKNGPGLDPSGSTTPGYASENTAEPTDCPYDLTTGSDAW